MKTRRLLIDATICLSLIVAFTVCTQKGQIGQKVFAATLCEEKLSKNSGLDRDRIVIVYNNFDKSNSGLHSDWGFAAWIEKDGKVILFDAGEKGEILAENMKKLDLDPARINHVVISHKHEDHIGGMKYIGQFLSKNVKIHIPAQLPDEQRREYDSLLNFVAKNEYEEIEEGIWITETMRGTVNKIPEQALVVVGDDTFVIIVGCSHPGIDKICENVVLHFPDKVPEMFTGGSHLSKTDSESVKAISEKIKKLGFKKVAPSHCTGEVAIEIFREEWKEKYIRLFLGDVYPLKKDNTSAVIYFPNDTAAFKIKTDPVLGAKVNAWWYNTRHGNFYNAQNIKANQPFDRLPHDKNRIFQFSPPGGSGYGYD